MNPKPFLDTNVLVYAYTNDDGRNDKAVTLLQKGGVVSVQILNEFVDVARKKLCFDWARVGYALDDLGRLLGSPMALTAELHREAVEIARQHGLRIYDSLVVSAARSAGCQILYSEHLQHGRVFGGLQIINPFLSGA